MNDWPTTRVKKSSWEFSEGAFKAFLTWLDDGTESDGRSYLAIQQRLTAYFDRKGCQTPVNLADETLNRVGRRLEEEGEIITEAPAKYCYTVARFVFLEYIRDNARRGEVPLDDVLERRISDQTAVQNSDEERELKERTFKCLESCSENLVPANRSLILRYYFGVERTKIENRRQMAGELGISVNALSIRACRIRDKLEHCVTNCVDGK